MENSFWNVKYASMPFHPDFPKVFRKLSETQNFQAEEFTRLSLDTVSEGDIVRFFLIRPIFPPPLEISKLHGADPRVDSF